jgi:hypothetical protein
MIDNIIERVRGLTGPDREVDAVVFEFFGGLSWVVPPAYTASLDAVVSLIERELPSYRWQCGNDGPGISAFGFVGRDDEPAHLGETPALALLLAALTAIKERDE